MSTTVDHLRVGHRVTVLQEFTDANGITLRAGEGGIVSRLSWNPLRMEIHMGIAQEGKQLDLVFPVKAANGPRNGHMRDYFELGEDVTAPRIHPVFHDRSKRQMIIPPSAVDYSSGNKHGGSRIAQDLAGPDRLEAMEKDLLAAHDHIGVAASIAEIYAERMRAFQRAGNESRAIAAFKLAVGWMASYASSATGGGEGAALSYECDQFRESLAREFGYDPTENR